ncbi:MBL fold metallo-hydrolase [Oceanicoccus sagamiensis]|uniref:Ribonuclease Z n=1 Tax=Oceanicoccus sagamiensis TaxID=716816 RepID=A0A1X9NMQ2_9GAMM|nr:MBL fold metallo-hydrolase [Oceanicoccus sagamiensis]ARN75183.1 ribonuclease Z [Oceanicoccus sagamiensis]
MPRKRILFPALIMLLLLIIYSQRAPLMLSVMERNLPTIMSTDVAAELGEGLHIAICGAGGPLPDPKRSGACMLVIAGESIIVIDAGSGGARNINRMRLGMGNVDAVMLTHFHSDHIDGLGEVATLRWVSTGNTSPLPVIAPEGVEKIVEGFNLAYSFDVQYRHDHHGDTVAPLSGKGMIAQGFSTPADGEAAIVWDQDGLKVTAFRVSHNPVEPAVGYRFDYLGRSLVISGDTVRSDNLEYFAKDTDLLLHEALSMKLVKLMNRSAEKIGNKVMAKVTYDILDYHTSPVEAAQSAQTAGARHLALYHIVPPIVLPGQAAIYLDGVEQAYQGPTTLTEDGMIFSLPANSTDVLQLSGF